MISTRIAIDNSPHKSGIMTANYLEVFPKRLQPMPAPDIVLRFGMTKGFEIFVEGIEVQQDVRQELAA